jgi:hypothetical protein
MEPELAAELIAGVPPPVALANERTRRLMEQSAAAGRHLAEREDDELEAMRVGGAIDEMLTVVLPARLKRQQEAEGILILILAAGCRAEVRAGAIRVEPVEDVPADVVGWLADPAKREALEELLDERQATDRSDHRAA